MTTTSSSFLHVLALALLALAITASVSAQVFTADDADELVCSASDIEVIGSGVVTNEPCNCPAGQTFDADVQFTINSKSSGRFCFTLYLCRGNVALEPVTVDVEVVRGTKTYTAKFPNYICDEPNPCFGFLPAGQTAGTVFPKGVNCPPNQCCSAITYQPTNQATCPIAPPDKLNPAKCRFQQICIVSRTVTATCKTGCNGAACTGSYEASVEVCGDGFSNPKTFSLEDANGNQLGTPITSSIPSERCKTITFTVNQDNLVVFGKVTDAVCTDGNEALAGTFRFANPVQVTLAPFQKTSCTGGGTFTASAVAGTGTPDYTFSFNNGPFTSNNVFSYVPVLDDTCRTTTVTIKDSKGCTASANRVVSQCVTTTQC